MDILFSLCVLIISMYTLIKGADFLVDGGSSLAKKWGMSHLVIGLTIVAFGTSAPEFFVNVSASLQNNSGITMGNVVGSNIANTMLGIGITALIIPLTIGRSTVWKEIPFMLLATFLLLVFASDIFFDASVINSITRSESIALLALFVIFMVYTYGIGQVGGEEENVTEYGMGKSILYFIGGIALLAAGGHFGVESATHLAHSFGISDRIIGLTIVALGTSLPDIIVTVVSAVRGKASMAVGNIVGSNIFNILWVLGVSACITPVVVPEGSHIDMMVLFGVTIFLMTFLHIRQYFQDTSVQHVIRRAEGIILSSAYFIYMFFLVWMEM